ncbi:Hpt domain-containing protein [Alteraurantiacibacter aquimixticola]|nr:Hpt domain-containing protein [Alteraurantiacibacter aquimixticola]
MRFAMFDPKHLLEDLPREAVPALIAQFMEQAFADLEALDRCLEAEDFGKAQEVAHHLKGGAAAMGAREIARQAHAIEQAAAGRSEKVELGALRSCVEQTQVELAAFRAMLER